jgi:hypothetical protein
VGDEGVEAVRGVHKLSLSALLVHQLKQKKKIMIAIVSTLIIVMELCLETIYISCLIKKYAYKKTKKKKKDFLPISNQQGK